MFIAGIFLSHVATTGQLNTFENGLKTTIFQESRSQQGFNENAKTELFTKIYLVSDSNKISQISDNTKTRDALELPHISSLKLDHFENQRIITIGKTNKFPHTLFNHAHLGTTFQPLRPHVSAVSQFEKRVIEPGERELIFARITSMRKEETRFYDHVLFGKSFDATELTYEVYYCADNFWFNPYDRQGKPISVSRNREPKWPQFPAKKVMAFFEEFTP